jgi:hypothetical protein
LPQARDNQANLSMASGLTEKQWTIAELLKQIAASSDSPKT